MSRMCYFGDLYTSTNRIYTSPIAYSTIPGISMAGRMNSLRGCVITQDNPLHASYILSVIMYFDIILHTIRMSSFSKTEEQEALGASGGRKFQII